MVCHIRLPIALLLYRTIQMAYSEKFEAAGQLSRKWHSNPNERKHQLPGSPLCPTTKKLIFHNPRRTSIKDSISDTLYQKMSSRLTGFSPGAGEIRMTVRSWS